MSKKTGDEFVLIKNYLPYFNYMREILNKNKYYR